MKQQVLIIAIVLAASCTASAQVMAPLIVQPRLIRWPLSDGMAWLTLMDDGHQLRVDLAGRSVPEFRGETPAPPSAEGLQVWLLRKDGTAAPRRSPLREAAWASMGGWGTRSLQIVFEHAPFGELAGVIVSANGKLIVREMPLPVK